MEWSDKVTGLNSRTDIRSGFCTLLLKLLHSEFTLKSNSNKNGWHRRKKKTLFHKIWNNVPTKNVKFINETQVNHTQILYIHKKNNSKNENEKKNQANKLFFIRKVSGKKNPA